MTGHEEKSGGGQVEFAKTESGVVEVKESAQPPACPRRALLDHQMVIMDIAGNDHGHIVRRIQRVGRGKQCWNLIQPAGREALFTVPANARLQARTDVCRPVCIELWQVGSRHIVDGGDEFAQVTRQPSLFRLFGDANGDRVVNGADFIQLGAAFGIAVLGSAFNIGYRQEIAGQLTGLPRSLAAGAREAPAIALRIAGGLSKGSALTNAARDAFTVGMRYALAVGVVLLLLGSLFVWIRGTSRVEAPEEDVLDLSEELVAVEA